ncbi:MAG: PHB depolymerase family esterase [Acidimicrobiales bacterium]
MTTAAKAVREEKRTITMDVPTGAPADSGERFYLLTNPDHEPDTPVPLVLDLHGLAEGALVHTMMSAFSDLAEKEGFAVVFPNGTGSPVGWNVGIDATNSIDLAFISTMLDTLGQDLCIDESRIYATGLSNGAMMSSALGCALSERIAAIAPVAGVTKLDDCDPGRPVPVLAFHGTADDILLFNGGVGSGLGRALGGAETSSTTTTTLPADLDGEGYPATVAAWAEHNGCEPDARDEDVSDEVIRRVYDCPEGGDVEFAIIKGGGHTWPGSEFSKSIANIVGPTTFDIDATGEIWAFFQRFRLP